MNRHKISGLYSWKEQKHRKPLILQGARQVGKTHLLKTFALEAFKKSFYINFEEQNSFLEAFKGDLSPNNIVKLLEFLFEEEIDINEDLIIFDEIQACPRAITSLKYFCEQMPRLAICAAGSLLGVALNTESFPVGKVETHWLYPLSFSEFLLAIGETKAHEAFMELSLEKLPPAVIHSKLWKLFTYYLITGGMPEVVKYFADKNDISLKIFNEIRRLQQELIRNHLLDIAKHSGKQNAMHIERIFRSIPGQLARETSGRTRKYIFKDVLPGSSRYSRFAGPIDWLQKAQLILRCPVLSHSDYPLSAQVKESRFKLYLFDVGLLGALSEISPKAILDYDFGSYKGYFVENFVAQELTNREHVSLYSWAGRTSEIEFLIQGESSIVPVEVKAGKNVRSRSLGAYIEKYHPKRAYILSGRPTQHAQAALVRHLPIYAACKL